MTNGTGLTATIEPRDYPLDNETITEYAKQLEADGRLKRSILVNIAFYLFSRVCHIEPGDWIGVSVTFDFKVISRLEEHFAAAFNQEFWESSAELILSQLDTLKRQGNSAPTSTDQFEALARHSCSNVKAIEIQRLFLVNPDEETIENLLGFSEQIKRATSKFGGLQQEMLQKAFAHRDPQTGLTAWNPELWFGIPSLGNEEARRVTWAQTAHRLEIRKLINRVMTGRLVTALEFTPLGLAVVNRLRKDENHYSVVTKNFLS
jgi:hypothetical protein